VINGEKKPIKNKRLKKIINDKKQTIKELKISPFGRQLCPMFVQPASANCIMHRNP
jgi:hypothetical protein